MFMVLHMVWGRKPTNSEMVFDGVFNTWNAAFETAVELAVNQEPDPGEIRTEDDARSAILETFPANGKELEILFNNAQDLHFERGGFTSFWDSQPSEDSRLFKIIPFNSPS